MRVLRRHEDGAYDVSVNLDETIHLGDAAACLSLLCAGDQESKIRAALGFYLDQSKTSLTSVSYTHLTLPTILLV